MCTLVRECDSSHSMFTEVGLSSVRKVWDDARIMSAEKIFLRGLGVDVA